jgi:hypothetical protein
LAANVGSHLPTFSTRLLSFFFKFASNRLSMDKTWLSVLLIRESFKLSQYKYHPAFSKKFLLLKLVPLAPQTDQNEIIGKILVSGPDGGGGIRVNRTFSTEISKFLAKGGEDCSSCSISKSTHDARVLQRLSVVYIKTIALRIFFLSQTRSLELSLDHAGVKRHVVNGHGSNGLLTDRSAFAAEPTESNVFPEVRDDWLRS